MNAPFFIDRPDVIHAAVCEVLTGIFPTIRPDTLLSSEKISHTTSWVRQVGMYLMNRRLHVNASETAHHFGRDRTTVMEAIRDAMRVVGSKTYVRCYERPSIEDGWQAVTIDLAKA